MKYLQMFIIGTESATAENVIAAVRPSEEAIKAAKEADIPEMEMEMAVAMLLAEMGKLVYEKLGEEHGWSDAMNLIMEMGVIANAACVVFPLEADAGGPSPQSFWDEAMDNIWNSPEKEVVVRALARLALGNPEA